VHCIVIIKNFFTHIFRSFRFNIIKISDSFLFYIIKKVLTLGQKLKINITPHLFSSPIPDMKRLEKHSWLKESELVGIDMKKKEQVELLSIFKEKFKEEYNKFPQGIKL